MSGEKAHHIYETYKYAVMPHGRHIYAKAYDMEQATMCAYPQSDHALPHWEFILWCCAGCPHINLPDQEQIKNMKKQHPQLGFTFITSLHVVLIMVEFHLKTIKYFTCVNNNLHQITLQKYAPEKNSL